MPDGDQLNPTEILSQAIEACEIHRRRHVRMSQTILLGVLVLLTAIGFFSVYYARLEAPLHYRRYLDLRWEIAQREKEIESHISDLDDKESELASAKGELSQFEEKANLLPSFITKETDSKKDSGQRQKKGAKSYSPPSSREDTNTPHGWEYYSWSSQDEYVDEKVDLASDIGEAKAKVESLSQRINSLQKTIEASQSKLLALQERADRSVTEAPPLLSDSFLLGLVGLIVLIVGVFTSLYRLHLREITKNEQYKLGFLRIHIAAWTSTVEGFQDEVRKTLTEGAFAFAAEESSGSGRKKLESPLPGHPTSDLATIVANQVMERIKNISGRQS